MTDPQRHGLKLLAYWTGAALVSLGLWYGILWGVRMVVARIAEAL